MGMSSMSMTTVTFTVTADKDITGYWLTVGDQDLEIVNDIGEIDLPRGARRSLSWWMTGPSGKSISFVAYDSTGKQLAKIDKSRVPPGETEGAGSIKFTV